MIDTSMLGRRARKDVCMAILSLDEFTEVNAMNQHGRSALHTASSHGLVEARLANKFRTFQRRKTSS